MQDASWHSLSIWSVGLQTGSGSATLTETVKLVNSKVCRFNRCCYLPGMLQFAVRRCVYRHEGRLLCYSKGIWKLCKASGVMV